MDELHESPECRTMRDAMQRGDWREFHFDKWRLHFYRAHAQIILWAWQQFRKQQSADMHPTPNAKSTWSYLTNARNYERYKTIVHVPRDVPEDSDVWTTEQRAQWDDFDQWFCVFATFVRSECMPVIRTVLLDAGFDWCGAMRKFNARCDVYYLGEEDVSW